MSAVSRQALTLLKVPVGKVCPGISTDGPPPSVLQCPAVIMYATEPSITGMPLVHWPKLVRYREPPQNGTVSAWRVEVARSRVPRVMNSGIRDLARRLDRAAGPSAPSTVTATPLPSVAGAALTTRP